MQPKHGVMYSLSKKKVAEHGGFDEDDAHVGLLISNPALEAATVATEVRTKQVAPTIVRALGLDPRALDAVRIEHTQVAKPNVSAAAGRGRKGGLAPKIPHFSARSPTDCRRLPGAPKYGPGVAA